MNHLNDLIELNDGVIIITGKGGVGKTTAATLIGVLRASYENEEDEGDVRNTLMISADPFHSVRGALNYWRDLMPNHRSRVLKKQLNGKLYVNELEPTGNKAYRIRDKINNGLYTEYELLLGKEIIKGFDGLMIIDTDSLEGLQRLLSYAIDNEELGDIIRDKAKIIPVTTMEDMSLEKVDQFFSEPFKEFEKFMPRLEYLIINNARKDSWLEYADCFTKLRPAKKIVLYEQNFEPVGEGLINLLRPPEKEESFTKYELKSTRLPDRRVMMFCGKGGQGKTTVSCAYALKKALQGRTVYIISADAKSSLSTCFGVKIPGYDWDGWWYNLGRTKEYEGLNIFVMKEGEYLDSLPGTSFYKAMRAVAKYEVMDCLVIDAPPSGNIKKNMDTGREDYDFMQEWMFKLDLMQLKIRGKFSKRSKDVMNILKDRREAYELSSLVMLSDDFLAVPVLQPTMTALRETEKLVPELAFREINPYLFWDYNDVELPKPLIINKVKDKQYQQEVLDKIENEWFPPDYLYSYTVIPEFSEEPRCRAMLEKVAEYL